MTLRSILAAALVALVAAGLALWSAGARAAALTIAGGALFCLGLAARELVPAGARENGSRPAPTEARVGPDRGSDGWEPRPGLPFHATDEAEAEAVLAAEDLYRGEPAPRSYSPRRHRRAWFLVTGGGFDGAERATVALYVRDGELWLQVRPHRRHRVFEAPLAQLARQVLWLQARREATPDGTPS